MLYLLPVRTLCTTRTASRTELRSRRVGAP